MLGTYVLYVDGNGDEHFALVVKDNVDETVNLFVYDYSKVVENVNDKSSVFCFKHIT